MFVRDVSLQELRKGGTQYESRQCNNKAGAVVEIVTALAEGRELPNNIPENMEITTWVRDFLAGKARAEDFRNGREL